MSSDSDRIASIEVGIPGPAGAGITAAEKTSFDSRLTALESGTGGIVFQDEGSPLATRGTTLNVTGAGGAVSGAGATKTLNIPGSSLTVEEDNVTVATGITTLDFNGDDFNLTESPTGEINVNRNRPATIFADKPNDGPFTGMTTTLATIDQVDIGPLALNIAYDIEVIVIMRGGPDATDYLQAYARIASDSSVVGTKTGTVGGERTITARAYKLNVVGDGVTSYTLYARGKQVASGTGSVAACHIIGRATPR